MQSFSHFPREAPTGFTIRAMRRADIDQVVQNEVRAYEHPWSRRIFNDCLLAGYESRVLLQEGRIIGHGVVAVALGECHLLTLCVHPDHQNRGYGRRLLQHLLERAWQQDAQECFLEVRPSNRPARSLYYSMGFEQVGERKNYYPLAEGREDALILACHLPL